MDEMSRAFGKSPFSIAEDTLPDLAEIGIDVVERIAIKGDKGYRQEYRRWIRNQY